MKNLSARLASLETCASSSPYQFSSEVLPILCLFLCLTNTYIIPANINITTTIPIDTIILTTSITTMNFSSICIKTTNSMINNQKILRVCLEWLSSFGLLCHSCCMGKSFYNIGLSLTLASFLDPKLCQARQASSFACLCIPVRC